VKNKPTDNPNLPRTEDGRLLAFVKGGKKASKTNKNKHGKDFYKGIGAMGGLKSRGGGFASATPEQRREWGRMGGTKSRRD